MGNNFGSPETKTVRKNTADEVVPKEEAADNVASSDIGHSVASQYSNEMRTNRKRKAHDKETKKDSSMSTFRGDCSEKMLKAEGDENTTTANREEFSPRVANITPDNVTSGDMGYSKRLRCKDQMKNRSRCIRYDKGGEMDSIDTTSGDDDSDMKLVTEDSDKPERHPIVSSWHWLLTSDGTFATADNISSSRKSRKRSRAKPHENTVVASKKSQSSTWYWLLGSGDSSVTTENTTRPRKRRYVSIERQKMEDAKWEKKFKRLVAYKNKHNTTLVPVKTPIIGRWAETMRWKHRQGQVLKKRVARLDSIGFDWQGVNGPHYDWMTMYNCLVAHEKKHKTTQVSPRGPNERLGRWIMCQRRRYVLGELDSDKVEQLKSIGFEWRLRRGRRSGKALSCSRKRKRSRL